MKHAHLLLCFTLFHGFESVAASKERAWFDEGFYFEGTLPSPRTQHGFTSAAQRMYIFGGGNNKGGMCILLLNLRLVRLNV